MSPARVTKRLGPADQNWQFNEVTTIFCKRQLNNAESQSNIIKEKAQTISQKIIISDKHQQIKTIRKPKEYHYRVY